MNEYKIQVNGETIDGQQEMKHAEYEIAAIMNERDCDILLDLLEDTISSSKKIYNYAVVQL